MRYIIDKYRNSFLIEVNLLVFVLFTLVYPHATLQLTFLNFLLFLGLSAPSVVFGILLIIRKKDGTGTTEFFYNRAFNALGIVNNYFFAISIKGLWSVFTAGRILLLIFYLIFFTLSVLINSFELCYALGFFDKLIPVRDDSLKKENVTKNLAQEARIERLDKVVSTKRFFVLFAAILAVFFFIYPLVTQLFTVPLGGDYTQQQIPFYTNGYDDWWHFIKTGEFPLWDSNTFLGANNVGSNSFYYALNPFFLPILLFPRELIPQGLAILMIAKFTLAAVTMRLYLKYMGVSEKEARFFAIIYAFCGWNVYYLWFNHFMEVAVIFPLIFLGIEKLIKEKNMRILVFSLALIGFANYFFLMTVLVLAFLYAVVRYIQQLPRVEPSVIGLGIIAFLLGILISGVVLFPSLAVALNSDRAVDSRYLENLLTAFKNTNFKELWNIITKWETQNSGYTYKKYYPLISYFFPVLSNRSVALLNTSNYDNTISSLFTFSPVILLLIPSLYSSIKRRKISHLILTGVFLFAIFTPFTYNLLHGFTKEYGRWQLIVDFVLITYVAMSIPYLKEEKPFIFDLSLVINLILMAITVKIAYSYENKSGFSYMYEREYIIYYQFFMIFVTYLLYRFLNKNKGFYYIRNAVLVVEIIVMGTVTMFGHGIISYRNSVNGGLQSYKDDMVAIRSIQALDKSYYRIYNTNARHGHHNLPMRENYNGVSTFHSLYNFELMPFNDWSRINTSNTKGWSLGVYERRGFINDFLQIKYYVLNEKDSVIFWSGDKSPTYAPYKNVPNTYVYRDDLSTDNRFVYYMEESFNIGFGVDYALTYEKYDPIGDEYYDAIKSAGSRAPVENEELYLQTALLSKNDLDEVLKIAPHLGSETYDSFNRMNYTRLSSLSSLRVKYYEVPLHSYPYTAQLDGEYAPKPTPEWINENGVELLSGALPKYLDGSKHVIEYTKNDGSNLINGPGEIIMNLPLSYFDKGLNYNVFLYDENYNVVTWDNHGSQPSYYDDWKVYRSFHTPVPIKKISLIPIGERRRPLNQELYIYNQEVINNIRRNAIENTLLDVRFSTNTMSFKSNFDSVKFVVTTIPYDVGWKLKNALDEELKVYKVQGGFVGFLSHEGDMTYTMSFTPQYLNMGLILTFSALLITGLLELNVYVFKRYVKKRKSDENSSLNE